MKIKKDDKRQDRKLDIPKFTPSANINQELDKVKFKQHKVKTKETVKLQKTNDDLVLDTQEVTSSLDSKFDTIKVSTIDLEDEMSKFLEEDYSQIEADTITINKAPKQSTGADSKLAAGKSSKSDTPKVKRRISKRGKRLIFGASIFTFLIIVFLIIAISISNNEQRFINRNLQSSVAINDYHVYGEALNLETDTQIKDVSLYNRQTKSNLEVEYSDAIDFGINFKNISEGEYFLFINGQLAVALEPLKLEYNTITRNDASKQITISTIDQNVLTISVKDVASEQVDILIDPSKGGIQGYSGYDNEQTEQSLSLKYAKALKSELKSRGYNVELSRTDDSVPGGCSYDDLYCSDGRLAMAYDTNAKLYINIGFNISGFSGFEITDSYLSSHQLSSEIASNLSTVISPSNRTDMQVSEGVYNQTYENSTGELVDYDYAIRETGGSIMNSDNQEASFNTNYKGAQAIKIQLGYITTADDYDQLTDLQTEEAIVIAICDAIDEYLS